MRVGEGQQHSARGWTFSATPWPRGVPPARPQATLLMLPAVGIKMPWAASFDPASMRDIEVRVGFQFHLWNPPANAMCTFRSGQVARQRGETVWLPCDKPMPGNVVSVHIRRGRLGPGRVPHLHACVALWLAQLLHAPPGCPGL